MKVSLVLASLTDLYGHSIFRTVLVFQATHSNRHADSLLLKTGQNSSRKAQLVQDWNHIIESFFKTEVPGSCQSKSGSSSTASPTYRVARDHIVRSICRCRLLCKVKIECNSSIVRSASRLGFHRPLSNQTTYVVFLTCAGSSLTVPFWAS